MCVCVCVCVWNLAGGGGGGGGGGGISIGTLQTYCFTCSLSELNGFRFGCWHFNSDISVP